MRVLQLGVGSLGEVVARTLAVEPEASTMVLADIDERRLAEVAPKLPAGEVDTLQLDVFQTGIPVACAAIMLARGLIGETGVLPPERIDPWPFLELMTSHGTPWNVVDLPEDTQSSDRDRARDIHLRERACQESN